MIAHVINQETRKVNKNKKTNRTFDKTNEDNFFFNCQEHLKELSKMSANTKTYKDAFSLFDKKGTGKVSPDALGDLLRAVGQNPTLQEISELQGQLSGDLDFDTYVQIINRPDGFKPLGEPEEYIKGFQVFDKEGTGYIGVGELRYILTSIGEKLSDSEVDELLKGVNVTKDGNVDYVEFVKSILAQ